MTIWFNLIGIMTIACGIVLKNTSITAVGCAIALGSSTPIIYQGIRSNIPKSLSSAQRLRLVITITMVVVVICLLKINGFFDYVGGLSAGTDWNLVGAVGIWGGALGQGSIATLAAFFSWQQYIVSRELTLEQNRLNRQQNTITQQQTIDNYFQGICDLVLDDDGFLEDWPQERAFAAGRTAALLGSVNAAGKARVLRFLSRTKLLTPLQRDLRLGRVILNGTGGYDEDRIYGMRVIDLKMMLSETDISETDLRWTDVSDANLIRANLSGCDLVKANFSRAILYEANLNGTDVKGTRFFYGTAELASPRNRNQTPNYTTGEFTGAVVENTDFTNVQEMSEDQRKYCCNWCGEASRQTIPGGCEGIPSKLSAKKI